MGRGVSFDGVNRLRALTAEIPSRFVWIIRRSWNDRPEDSLRTFCSVWLSGASRASTIRLRTPSCSMKAITSCCAPAPIDSMATTAATPKIMPSIVSIERSLCARRFSSPRRNSGRKSVDQRWPRASIIYWPGGFAPPVPPALPLVRRGPLHPGWLAPLRGRDRPLHSARATRFLARRSSLRSPRLRRRPFAWLTRCRSLLGALSFGGGRAGDRPARRFRSRGRHVGIDERDDVPFVESADRRAAFGAIDDLHVPAIEAIANLQEHVVPARLFEHGL